jgi:hypothetical protein
MSKLKVLFLCLLLATPGMAATVIYGDGGIEATVIVPGNDDEETVNSLLGLQLSDLGKDEEPPFEVSISDTGDFYLVAKAGGSIAIFPISNYIPGDDILLEPFNYNISGEPIDISHVTLYGTAAAVPEPSRAFMAMSGFFVLLMGRRKRPGMVKKTRIKVLTPR